jgi:hypothetical protein
MLQFKRTCKRVTGNYSEKICTTGNFQAVEKAFAMSFIATGILTIFNNK